jgi:glyoxylate utilization-related uncharacterized protein
MNGNRRTFTQAHRLLTTCAVLAAAAIALAQQEAPSLRITTLAQTTLPSVVTTPLQFRLVQVTLPAGETVVSEIAEGMLFQVSGTLTVTTADHRVHLAPGGGAYLADSPTATFAPSGGEDAVFLHFLLLPVGAASRPHTVDGGTVIELFRSTDALPDLASGAYDFDLTLLEFPAHLPINDAHYRTGGALYYVLTGAGEFTVDGTTDRKPAGSVILEPYGLVHQWANAHDDVTTVVLANVSPAGAPAVAFGRPPP